MIQRTDGLGELRPFSPPPPYFYKKDATRKGKYLTVWDAEEGETKRRARERLLTQAGLSAAPALSSVYRRGWSRSFWQPAGRQD